MLRYVKSSYTIDDENRQAAIDYLYKYTNLDEDAAEFVVDEWFNDDLLKCAENTAYLMHQFTWDEWEEVQDDYDPDYTTIIQDAAFDGVVIIEG